MKAYDKIKILLKLVSDTRHPKIFSFHDCLPDVFSHYIELLIAKRYKILDARELLERLDSRRRFKKEVVLTFDDGRRNCWTVIFPLLKKYKIKAQFFVIPSRLSDTQEYFPNLEDYWNGKVSWENLYLSHRKQPYLTWKELKVMRASGLVEVFSHSLKHEVVAVGSRVIDFQHPGVYEMPVYFDEWFADGAPPPETLWGVPVYERLWAPLAANVYLPNRKIDLMMNEFVKKSGGFLFFKKKDWRKILFDHFAGQKNNFSPGHFMKTAEREDACTSVAESRKLIETKLNNACAFFSLPLYQGYEEIRPFLEVAEYRAVMTGFAGGERSGSRLFLLNRIPSFWIKFLAYL